MFLKFFSQYIYRIPMGIFNLIFFFFDKAKIIKSTLLFNIIEYKSNYKNDNLSFFFLPLFVNVYHISNEIYQIIKKKKVVSIVSVLIFFDDEGSSVYTHSLNSSNGLYNLNNFDEWVSCLLVNLVEKLELYSSFKKISLVVKVKIIENL